ncbi:MAG: ABC transporter substrate-binding protein, partial [Stackebrandtia sp.]
MRRRTAFKLLGGAAATALVGACGSDGGSTALTVGMPNGPLAENNNPFVATSSGNSLGYKWLLWEPLAQVNLIAPDTEPTPWLAKEWSWSKDYTSVSLAIRDGVTWSDGEKFTVEDVAFTFNMIKDNDALNTDAIPYKEISAGEDTVEITFDSPQFVNQG